ncbi:MAG: bifunctional folylpolyglutamate synthase/dihydrofolate synthase [Candidatus Longimicrobiales bacterium M2_2A_002]
MTELSYGALLDQLFPRLTGGIRWGLDRTLRMLAAVDDPHTAYPSVHIAGTNGKGSVAAIIESVLRRHGLRTGLYTSPHLVDFRERIRIDGLPITETELLTTARVLWPQIEAEAPSFFEAATVIAFLALERAAVDVAVVEVGMGGRLDSTNVVDPDVVVITNVAMDHAQYLGDDLTTIAGEKAGVIKSGVPVVTGETDPVVLDVIRRTAEERGAPLCEVPPPVAELDARGTTVVMDTVWGELSLRVPLAGRHQAQNLAVAVRALERMPPERCPDRAALVEGAAGVAWPGRLQSETVDGVTWVFDVAHNAAGTRSLLEALPVLRPERPLVALIGVLGDKDWNGMLPPLFDAMDAVVLAEPPSAPAQRRWDPEAVLEHLDAPATVRVIRPFAAAVSGAAALAEGGTVVCTGSVHTVGDAMLALGLPPFAEPAGLQPEGDAA